MGQENCNTSRKKHKHILLNERITIEQMLKAKCDFDEVSRVIGCSLKTLKREIARGSWGQMHSYLTCSKVYSFDVGQRKHQEKGRNKDLYAKINNDPKLRKYLENKIKNEKYSPEAALLKAKE